MATSPGPLGLLPLYHAAAFAVLFFQSALSNLLFPPVSSGATVCLACAQIPALLSAMFCGALYPNSGLFTYSDGELGIEFVCWAVFSLLGVLMAIDGFTRRPKPGGMRALLLGVLGNMQAFVYLTSHIGKYSVGDVWHGYLELVRLDDGWISHAPVIVNLLLLAIAIPVLLAATVLLSLATIYLLLPALPRSVVFFAWGFTAADGPALRMCLISDITLVIYYIAYTWIQDSPGIRLNLLMGGNVLSLAAFLYSWQSNDQKQRQLLKKTQ
jgi:uncharacterized membrane protein (UPF0136 family)